MELQTAKGVRDYPPEEKIVKQQVTDLLKETFERYGFNPLETPVLERMDVLVSKYTGGEEIVKEIFKLKDQGDRDLALRYDLTVPLARFVGMHPQMKMPFKRYAMGPVFRDGPIKLGRYREFWQCDADIIGAKSMVADAEVLAIANSAFETLGMDVVIKVNNRKLLNGIMEHAGIFEKKEDAILSIDKLEKFGEKVVSEELAGKGFSAKAVSVLLKLLTHKHSLASLQDEITSSEGKEGLAELGELFGYLENFGVKTAALDISLARGLAYYTGTVFEVYLKDSKITSSVAAGGRYDQMIGKLLGSSQVYPAVGIAFGLDVICDALRLIGKASQKTVVKAFMIPIKTLPQTIAVAQELRKAGVSVEVDLMARGISKNLDYANAFQIPYVVFVGDEELKAGKYKLKDMVSGEEEMLAVDEIISKLH